MKVKPILTFVGTILALTLVTVDAKALTLDLGPFELQLGGSLTNRNRADLDDPICDAIFLHKRLELVLESDDSSKNERKLVTKRIIVEPYLFGIDKNDRPILRGNIISESLMKEVTVRYGDDEQPSAEERKNSDEEKKGSLFGIFSSKKSSNLGVNSLNARKITRIKIIENSHFDAPEKEDYDGDIKEIICVIQSDKEKKKK